MPVKTQFYGPTGTLAKELLVRRDPRIKTAGRAVPVHSMMVNHQLGSHTEFEITRIEIDGEIRDSVFTVAEIRKHR